jgi:hypothetical protein
VVARSRHTPHPTATSHFEMFDPGTTPTSAALGSPGRLTRPAQPSQCRSRH